jgi:hypothetical protein
VFIVRHVPVPKVSIVPHVTFYKENRIFEYVSIKVRINDIVKHKIHLHNKIISIKIKIFLGFKIFFTSPLLSICKSALQLLYAFYEMI